MQSFWQMQSSKDIEGLPYTILGFSSMASYSTWQWLIQSGSENGAAENPVKCHGVSWNSPNNSHSVDFCRYNTQYPPFLNNPNSEFQKSEILALTIKPVEKNIENRSRNKMTKWERPLIHQFLVQAWTTHPSGQARTPRSPPMGNIT